MVKSDTRCMLCIATGQGGLHTVIMERKLAAILSADVQGYSRLMGEDEEVTILTLMAYREVMTDLIEDYRGRVVDTPGDNLLAEFASVVDATQRAVAIQEELQRRNAQLPANRNMAFRIGINLGDVVVEGDRIYGEGVNLAARLEGLAEGGGICISGTVYDQVASRLDLQYIDLGEQRVKNIVTPVRAMRGSSRITVWFPNVLVTLLNSTTLGSSASGVSGIIPRSPDAGRGPARTRTRVDQCRTRAAR